MADANAARTTVMASGAVVVRQRPQLLLMKARVRASEATLELGLARLKGQREAAARWLTGLGAARVEAGEPHFADQAELDPMTRMRVARAKAMGKVPGADDGQKRAVRVVLTGIWEIAALSAEETLVLVDRLRFEAAGDAREPEPPEEVPPWPSPEEQMRSIVAQMQQLHQPPPDDGAPVFLYITRLGDEQRERASAEAFARAREGAERLARAAGMRLGRLGMLSLGAAGVDIHRHDRLMDRQRCAVLLAGCAYDLREDEIVSDDPRAAEFTISVNGHFSME